MLGKPETVGADSDLGGGAEALPKGAVSALVLLTVVNTISLIDRVQISALAQPIKQEFGLSDTQVGMLTGMAFGMTYAAAAIPLAWLSDRSNRGRLLSVALVFWSGMTALAGFAQGFWHLFATRVGVAAGEASFTPTAHAILADYYPPRRRAFAIGIESSGISLGILIGMAAAGWIGSAYGWRVAMLVAAAPGLLLGIVIWFVLKDPRRCSPASTAPPTPPPPGRFLEWAGPSYGWLVVLAMCNGIMTTGWAQWLPSFMMRTFELPLSTVGAAVGLASGLGLTCGSILGGWLSGRTYGRSGGAAFRPGIVISLAILPLFGLALWSPWPQASFAFVFLTTVLSGMLAPFIFGGIQNACDPRFRARAVAVALACVTVGSYAVMPPAVGALSDMFRPEFGEQSLRAALTALLFVPVLAAFAFWLLTRAFDRREVPAA